MYVFLAFCYDVIFSVPILALSTMNTIFKICIYGPRSSVNYYAWPIDFPYLCIQVDDILINP